MLIYNTTLIVNNFKVNAVQRAFHVLSFPGTGLYVLTHTGPKRRLRHNSGATRWAENQPLFDKRVSHFSSLEYGDISKHRPVVRCP